MSDKLTCPECGCMCKKCITSIRTWPENGELSSVDTLHLHQEIESLKRQLVEREYHCVQMETSVLNHAEQYPNGEWEHLQLELEIWKDKYERLYDSHKRMQKVNQSLEDKLLKLVDKFETEKNCLSKDVADLTNRLVEARLSINELEEQNDQYQNDCSIAIQLLQCKPSNFIAQKLSAFPSDVQDKVKLHFTPRPKHAIPPSRSSPDFRTIRVPIPTFPPTAMVYSLDHVPRSAPEADDDSIPDYVSAAILAKVLEERTRERLDKQEHCKVCWYRRTSMEHQDRGTQTFSTVDGTVPVHMKVRCGSNSSMESISMRSRNGSSASTETVI